MAKTNVVVERKLEQVKDGYEYKGTLTLGGVTLEFNAKFPEHIKGLDSLPEEPELADIQRLFQIEVKKEGELIELTDDEYGVFCEMLLEFIFDFYHYSQTRSANEGALAALMGDSKPFGMNLSIGSSGSVSYNFGDELCDLYRDRFGCAFAA